MRIVLISTDRDPWALGMRNISAVLKSAGQHTRLILMGSNKKLYSNQVLEETKELVKDSDIIGISCLSRGSDKTKQAIEYLRPLGMLIVWGGWHATLNPEDCAESADIVCMGEGEGMMLELTERLEKGREWKDMANAAYKDNDRMVMNPLRPLINNLDELPPVDFSCVDEFHLTPRGFVRVSSVSDKTQPGQIVFNGSRGCAHQCTYCCNAKLKEIYSGKGRFVREMSIQKYVDTTRALRQYFARGKYFFLSDEDLFARSVDELQEFSEEFPRKVGLPFECCGSPWHITQEKMDLMVRAGLWRIRMGIESGSECTKRDIYKRPTSNEVVLRSSHIINGYPQISATYFFLGANPYERKEDLLETVRFMLDLSYPYQAQIFNLVFFPGSILYECAVRDGLIKGKEDSGYELDFRGGLRYKGHAWKTKNLYLNGLLFLTEGKSNRYRVGLLPRFLIPALLYPKVVNFGEKHPVIIKGINSFKMFTLFLRGHGARCLKLLVGDPTSVYNLGKFVKSKLKHIRQMAPKV